MPTSLASKLKSWFKLNRLIPLLTVAGAGIAIVLSQINIIKLSIAENIIIALLALIAIDALSERLNLLESIEERLKNLSTDESLRDSTELLPPTQQAKYASDISIVAVHATSVILNYSAFYESKMREGCHIHIILLDPECSALESWNLINRDKIAKQEILASLRMLEDLVHYKAKGKCEVRLLNVFLPFSMFAIDLKKRTGSMTVAFHPYKLHGDRRPHIRLTKADSPEWFDYFRDQFDLAWQDSKMWSPQA